MFISGPIPIVTSLFLFLGRVALGGMFLLAGVRRVWPVHGVDADAQGNYPDLAGTMPFPEAMQLGVAELISQMGDRLNGFVGRAMELSPEWLPESLARFYGYALPWVEIVVGLFLIIGLLTRLVAGIGALVLISILVAVGLNWWPPQDLPFDARVVFIPLALLLFSVGSGAISIDRVLFRKRD